MSREQPIASTIHAGCRRSKTPYTFDPSATDNMMSPYLLAITALERSLIMSQVTWEDILVSMDDCSAKMLLLVPGCPPLVKLIGLQALIAPTIYGNDLRSLLDQVKTRAGSTVSVQGEGCYYFGVTSGFTGKQCRVVVFGSPEPACFVVMDEWDNDSTGAQLATIG